MCNKHKGPHTHAVSEYEVGQPIVHLSHGIGVIVGIEDRQLVNENVTRYYVLAIQDGGATKKVFVPVNNSKDRLRLPIDKAEAQKVLAYLALGTPDADIDHQTWNRRYRTYMEMIHTGETMNIAKVFVALRDLQSNKDLSFGERKLMDQARKLLSLEFQAIGIELPQ